MSRPSWPVLIGVLAIASAVGIWLIVANAILRSTELEPAEVESLIVLLVAGILIDGLVAGRALRGRVGIFGLGWLAIRVLISAAGLLPVTLPSYAIAVIALTRARMSRTADDDAVDVEADTDATGA
jgi:hypothetical protein